ncbi:hypothetical protein HPB47_014264 [Ixodes persulcatus]|uniref:Uncharacterized protein n=1 Tax=Ixodes persulcatus TaxID=34615 RepID=A0AC60QWM6_IXOPE|nr:hypothetical protein HPB47_014264 [Ixodes persulcatus]
MNEYTALNGRKGASLLTEGVKIILLQFAGGYLVILRVTPVLKQTQAPSFQGGISNVIVSLIFILGHCFNDKGK